MKILSTRNITYKGECKQCGTVFTATPQEVKSGLYEGFYAECPVCNSFIKVSQVHAGLDMAEYKKSTE